MITNQPIRSVAPVRRPVAPIAPVAPAKAVGGQVKARGSDPLPTFDNPEQYQHYVINLVALARATQADLTRAREAFDKGTGSQAEVDNFRERLDSVKLQLAVLRDNFPIPESWSRWKIFGGYGFDKEKFWREQVEAIPGKEVVVSPEPPKPEPAPAPAPVPAPVPADVSPAPLDGSELPPAFAKLIGDQVNEGLKAYNNSSGIKFMRGKLDGIRLMTKPRTDELSRQIDALAARGLTFQASSTRDYNGLYCTMVMIKAMLGNEPRLDDRARSAMRTLVAEGKQAYNNDGGIAYMRVRLQAIADLAAGRAGQDLAAVAGIAKLALADGSGSSTRDYYALYTGLQSVEAFLGTGGTLADRSVRLVQQLTAEGLKAYNNSGGINMARSYMQALVRLTSTVGDPRLQAVDTLARGALGSYQGTSTSDWQGLTSTFQVIQASLQ